MRRGGLAEQQRTTAALMADGIPGQARVDQLRDTGMRINENPRVQLQLTVTVPGCDPYAVTLTQIVSRISLGQFQPGAVIAVRVSPADRRVLLIA
jgi:hypothetical protein